MLSSDDGMGSPSPPTIHTEDLASDSCDVCRLGSTRPALASPPRVQVLSSSSRVSSVQCLVSDANALAADNRALRAQIEETTALHAGLATHASVLHDRNMALLQRNREGFDIGLAAFDRLQRRVEELESENTRLDEFAADLQTAADQSRHWETRYCVLEASSYEDACAAQDTLAAAQSHAAGLELQLAAGNDQVSSWRLNWLQNGVIRAETESAHSLNEPIHDDLRRVNALLTAYAEERQRDLGRVRDLEASVSTAEAVRIAAQAEQARSQAAETQAVARSARYRRGWLDIRRSAAQARAASEDRVHRLGSRVVDLEAELDRVRRDLDDRAAAWRRLLREARRGRESAHRVNTALSARLVAVVDAAGGTIAVDELIRSIETSVGPAVASAVPLPPNDPDLAQENEDYGSSVSAPASPLPRPGSSSTPRPPPSPTAASSGGSRSGGSRSGFPSPSPGGGSVRGGASNAGGGSPPGLGTPSPRRSSRSSTAADTAASDSAATQRQRSGSTLLFRQRHSGLQPSYQASPPPSPRVAFQFVHSDVPGWWVAL
ncbi:unnamed protein product [Phytophthora lilii]|uniref:Unnamed protein product n=1 Tax=Phytophthora lilii TaxID=2077276 RepID=A0A9W6UB67_9STRA|nr:unnamed protein product [Phytophthora lilii]